MDGAKGPPKGPIDRVKYELMLGDSLARNLVFEDASVFEGWLEFTATLKVDDFTARVRVSNGLDEILDFQQKLENLRDGKLTEAFYANIDGDLELRLKVIDPETINVHVKLTDHERSRIVSDFESEFMGLQRTLNVLKLLA